MNYVWHFNCMLTKDMRQTETDGQISGKSDVFPLVKYKIYSAICVWNEPRVILSDYEDVLEKRFFTFSLDLKFSSHSY